MGVVPGMSPGLGEHHGGGDNPAFIQYMYDWISTHDVAFHVYFNVVAPDGDHKLWPTTAFPNPRRSSRSCSDRRRSALVVPASSPQAGRSPLSPKKFEGYRDF